MAQSRFADAHQLLQQVVAQQKLQKQREAWMYLSKCASSFMLDLSKYPFDEALAIDVVTVKGDSYTEVLASNAEGLKLKKAEVAIFLPWNQIEPESVLGVYREAFELSLETLKGQQLTEHAICYAWLMGMAAQAEPAVEALSEVNGNFDKRWRATLAAIGD